MLRLVHLMREALRGTQRHSEALRGTQSHSEPLRASQSLSEPLNALRASHRQSRQHSSTSSTSAP